jgi:hypothetical protein
MCCPGDDFCGRAETLDANDTNSIVRRTRTARDIIGRDNVQTVVVVG